MLVQMYSCPCAREPVGFAPTTTMSPLTLFVDGSVVTTSLKCITLVNADAFNVTAFTEPPDVVTLTVMPLLVLVFVTEPIAAICSSAIAGTDFPPTVRVVADTLVTSKSAVLVTVRVLNVPDWADIEVGVRVAASIETAVT